MRNTKIAIIMGTGSFKVVQISASCTIQHLPSTIFLEDRQLMFTYRKFWEKCEEQGISKTKLIRHYKVGHDTIERLKTDRSVSMQTIQRLCNILNCELSDIAECYPDKKSSPQL